MKNAFKFVSNVLLAAVILSVLLPIQAQSENQKLVVHEDKIYPSHYFKYESAVKELIGAMKKYEYDVPFIQASSTRDFTYYYLTPINNFADLDKTPWKDLSNKMGDEKWKEMIKKMAGHYEFHRNIIVELDMKSSYIPEKPRIKDKETGFLYWDFIYLNDGATKKMDELFAEYKKICKEVGWEDTYYIYKSVFGAEFDLVIIVSPAKSFLDYVKIESKAKEKLADKTKGLKKKFFKLVKKYEMKIGNPRPDLSYFPEKKMEKPAK